MESLVLKRLFECTATFGDYVLHTALGGAYKHDR